MVPAIKIHSSFFQHYYPTVVSTYSSYSIEQNYGHATKKYRDVTDELEQRRNHRDES